MDNIMRGAVSGSNGTPCSLGVTPCYVRASLMAQMVKNPPAMWETSVLSLGWEDLLEEGMQSTLVFLPGESPWTEGPGGDHKELDTAE